MAGELCKSESISAVYAAASGISPAPSTRLASHKSIDASTAWTLSGLSQYEAPVKLRTNDELPEMMAALAARNRSWVSVASRRKSLQSTVNDDDLFVRSTGRSGRW